MDRAAFSNKIKELIHNTAEAIKFLRLENQSGDGVTTRLQKKRQAQQPEAEVCVKFCIFMYN
jgi:hypothetical protein